MNAQNDQAPPGVANSQQPAGVSQKAPVSDDVVRSSAAVSASKNSDNIDRVWIAKLKTAIKTTSTDPYARAEAISKLKAEYLESTHAGFQP